MSFSIGCWEFYRHQHTDWIQSIANCIATDITTETAKITATIGMAADTANMGFATAEATIADSTIGRAVRFKKNEQSLTAK